MREGQSVSATSPSVRTRAAERRRTWAVACSGFAAFLGLYMTQPLLPTLEAIFHASKAAVSLTLTATTLGVAIAAPLIGSVADRLGRRRVIVWSAWGLACSTLLDATATGLPSLVFWRFLQGLFTPGVFAVTIAYVQEEWTEGIGRALAIYVTGTVLGGFAGRMLSALIVAGGSWRIPFLAIGAGGGALALMVQAWLPQEPAPAARTAAGPLKEAIRSHLRNPRLLAAFAVGFCLLFSLVATFSYVTFHLAEAPFHLGPVALGFLFFTYLFGAAVTPPCGRAIDRFGHRKVLAIALALGMAGMLLTLAPYLWAVIAGLAVCCSSVFVAQAAATGFIGVAAERDKAVAVGLYVTCYYMGGSAGAELPGLLWRFGGWRACVALVVAVQALAILVALLGWDAVRAQAEDDPEALADRARDRTRSRRL